MLIASLREDFRSALRQFHRSPGYAVAVIFTLALGIGANTAIFSVLNAVMLRPLPYPQPERLSALMLHQQGPKGSDDDDSHDGETWELVRDNVPAVVAAANASSMSGGANLEAAGVSRYMQASRVSAHYFDVLGVKPAFGRTFNEDEDRVGGGNAAVISYELWQSAFGGNISVLGKPVMLKGEPYTIIGVLPPHTLTPTLAQVFTPLRATQTGEGEGNNFGIQMRLRDGATWPQANAQLAHLQPRIVKEGNSHGRSAWLYAMPLSKSLTADKRTPVLMLMLAVSFILLIACANLAGLTLVRTAKRSGEMATRLALGASRGALLRQLWAESMVLAIAGGAASLAIASLALQGLSHMLPPEILPVGGIGIDGRVIAFTFAVSLLTSFLFGALPALQSRRVDIRTAIAAGASRSVSSGAGNLRRAFIAGEVALTVVLLTGTALLLRTLTYLETLPPGFDANNVTTAKVSLDNARYHDAARFQRLMKESVAAMEKIPGVESAAAGLSLPYERGLNDGIKILDGAQSGKSDTVSVIYVTPHYFSTLRIPVVAGSHDLDTELNGTEKVVVVNRSFVEHDLHLKNPQDALGLHLDDGRIVAVVGDVVKAPGVSNGAPLMGERTVYVQAAQMNSELLAVVHVWFQPSWIVRTRDGMGGSGTAAQMQRALASIDPGLPFSGVYSMNDLRATALLTQRVELMLLGIVSLLALLLSAVGVYGLISSMVVQRTREIGIRIALGSTVSRAMLTIGSSGVTATAIGLTIGIALSMLGVRVLRSVLFGVSAYDPATFVGSVSLLAVVALTAAFVPTMRIAKIDPADTLRSE